MVMVAKINSLQCHNIIIALLLPNLKARYKTDNTCNDEVLDHAHHAHY